MNRRIEFIDIAKGITIFLVVWGHTSTNSEMQGPDCPLIVKILYSFHMPLFFFLSGLSMTVASEKIHTEWKSFLQKNILTVALPYFIWALIYCTFSFTNVSWILYGSWQALGKVATLTSLWFLSSLFVARILVQLVITYSPHKLWFPIAVVMVVIGLFLPHISIGYPWCADIAFVAAGCILLGALFKKPFIELGVQKISIMLGLLAVSIILFVASIYIDDDNFTIMLMCKGSYGIGIGPVVRVICGSFIVLLISLILRQYSERTTHTGLIGFFRYVGQYTLGVFILHKPFMQEIVIPQMTSWTEGILSVWLIRLLSAIIAMGVSLVVCNVIVHYVPELIGVFSKERLKSL